MKSYELQKKIECVNLIVIFSSIALCIGLIIPGSILIEKDTFGIGVTLCCIGVLQFIIGIIFSIVYFGKRRKPLLELRIMEIKETLNRCENKKEFLTSKKESFSFDDHQFLYNGRYFTYADYECYAVIENKIKALSNQLTLSLAFVKGKEVILIPLDKDVLSEMEKYGLKFVNQEDFEFYLENMDNLTKKVSHKLMYSLDPIIPLFFPKNAEEKKQFKKEKLIKTIISIASLALMLGIYFLLLWLSNSKTGNDISKKIGFSWIMKALFSFAFLATAFVKAKKVNWYYKLIIISFVVFYWITLFTSNRIFDFFLCIYSVIFFISGILFADKKDLNNTLINRFFGMFSIIVLFQVLNVADFSYQNDSLLWLYSIIPAALIMIAIVLIICIYYSRLRKKEKIRKKKMVYAYLTGIFGGLMLGYIWSVGMISNLNYALDFSTPQIIDCVVEKLVMDSKASDKAIVIYEEEKIEVSITRDEYYTLEEGDILPISLYQGAFRISYYIWE